MHDMPGRWGPIETIRLYPSEGKRVWGTREPYQAAEPRLTMACRRRRSLAPPPTEHDPRLNPDGAAEESIEMLAILDRVSQLSDLQVWIPQPTCSQQQPHVPCLRAAALTAYGVRRSIWGTGTRRDYTF